MIRDEKRRLPFTGISDQAIALSRLIVAGVLAIYVITYSPPEGSEAPGFLLPVGLGLAVGLAGVSLRQWHGADRLRQPLVPYIVVDGVMTMAFVVLFAFDPQRHLLVVGLGVVLEAALLMGLRAAVFTWAALALAYGLKEMVAEQAFDVPADPIGLALRLAILAGAALTTGAVVEANRATRAFSEERQETERLRDLDEMKTAFLAAVSHDLKNPLTAILGFSTTLEARFERLPAERTKEFLGHITNSGRKLQRMLDDLLDVDRMDRGTLEPYLAPTDVPALVRRTVEESELQSRSIVIHGEDLTIDVDPPKLERIIENLLTNAVKYTPSNTSIDVRIAAEDGGVLIAVEDRGHGISDEQKLALFDPFHRVPGAEKVAKGTGVGLSLVSRFTELHGGRAWVEDRPGGGASFRVFLPGTRPLPAANEPPGRDS